MIEGLSLYNFNDAYWELLVELLHHNDITQHSEVNMRAYLASKAKAITPAASGAALDVPWKLSVHLFLTSVVTILRIGWVLSS